MYHHAVRRETTMRRGIITEAAILPLLRWEEEVDAEEEVPTRVIPSSVEPREVWAAAGVPVDGVLYVAVKMGPAGKVAMKGASPL
jgi:hypothetical protein